MRVISGRLKMDDCTGWERRVSAVPDNRGNMAMGNARLGGPQELSGAHAAVRLQSAERGKGESELDQSRSGVRESCAGISGRYPDRKRAAEGDAIC